MKTTKKYLKEYTKKLIKTLKTLPSTEYYVCPYYYYQIAKEVAEELGYTYVEDHCVICGAKIYRLNVETKAKPICIKCALKILNRPFFAG